MPGTKRLKYNPYYVRKEFRRHVCRELMLPSGNPSGLELFPLDDEFVQTIADMYASPTKETLRSCGADNVHEWMLWTAGRIKYGFNYLNPTKRQFWLNERMYGAEPEQDPLEEDKIKLENIVEQKLDWAVETLQKQEKAEKVKNILRECLTTPDSDVIM